MRKILFALLLLPALSFAQTARDVQIDASYAVAPASENVTGYNCEYYTIEDGVQSGTTPCPGVVGLAGTHSFVLVGVTADYIDVGFQAVNAFGASGWTFLSSGPLILAPAGLPPSLPSNVNITATVL